MVLGKLVPKSLALQFPAKTALATCCRWSFRCSSTWFLAFLNGSGRAILKMFRVSHAGHGHIHSPDEIEFLIAESRKGGMLAVDDDQRLRRGLRLAARRFET
jgi:putative hemolysin